MKVRLTITVLSGLVLVALLVLAAGCEDSDLTISGDGAILLTANPGTVTIDPNQGETEGTSTLIASVFDSAGNPMANISVLFSATGGTLASGSVHVKTNQSGLAFDTLTLTTADPPSIEVKAQSSLVVTQPLTITLQVMEDNQPPEAVIIDVPAGEQEVGKIVTFDGSLSADPDGDIITCYQWTIDSTFNARDEVVQGPGASALQRTYNVEQDMSVILRVSDRGDTGSMCGANDPPAPEDMFSGLAEPLAYTITCANTPPVADAGPDQTVPITSPNVFLDGCNSTDEENPFDLDQYDWNCGNGSQPIVLSPPCQVYCQYRMVGSYVARLTVWDKGNGTIDPGTGTWDCQKSDADDVIIEIFQPTD
jgi:hypothetical protein